MNGNQSQTKNVVASIASNEEQARLRTILRAPEWNVQFVHTIRELKMAVRSAACRVAITGTRLPDGRNWKDVLESLEEFRDPPQLIVADRLADEALWAEVLNFGAYDLLITPFDAAEVQRVVLLAWEFHLREEARLHLSLVGP